MPDRSLTYGEKLVGFNFSASSGDLNHLNRRYAAAIDRLHALGASATDLEVKRLCYAAITETLVAHTLAVEALTWRSGQ
jgi:hypothetical protein